jgi:mannose-6-phosphate isomerase-like protein (cupin superfamily)
MEGVDAVNIEAMLGRFTDQWQPKRIARLNDYDVRIVKLQGEFTWHQHADTDEFFLVISGELTIQLRDRDVVLGPGELFVVPRGAEHCPRADAETAVLLLEPSTVVNTGDAGGDLTAEVETLS